MIQRIYRLLHTQNRMSPCRIIPRKKRIMSPKSHRLPTDVLRCPNALQTSPVFCCIEERLPGLGYET